VDWIHNEDVQNEMKNEIEDYLYDIRKEQCLDLSYDDMDRIMEKCLEIAKNRYAI